MFDFFTIAKEDPRIEGKSVGIDYFSWSDKVIVKFRDLK